jgi:hypothetical protein
MPRRLDYRDGRSLSVVVLLVVIAAALAIGARQ